VTTPSNPTLAVRQSRTERFRGALGELAGDDFAQNVAATLGTRVLLVTIGLATAVLVARSLGPEGRGLYAVALAVAAIGVQVGNLGLHASNTWAVSRNPRLLPTLIANSLLTSLVVGGIGALVAWVVLTAWPGIVDLPASLLALGLLAIPIGLAYLLLQNLLLGTGRIREFNAIELFVRIVTVAMLVAVILAGMVSALLAVLAGVIASTIGVLACFVALQNGLGGRLRPRVELLRIHAGYGLKAYSAALFSFLVLRFDLLMVQHFLGAQDAGYYSIAVAMADLLYMLPVVIGMLLFPRLAAMADERRRWRVASRMAVLVGLVMAGIAVVAALLAGPAITFLFGKEFLPAEPAFLWLLPGIVMLSAGTVLMNYGAAIGMPPITWVAPMIGFALNVVLNVRLIPPLGIVGASLSSTAAYAVVLALGGLGLHRFGRRTCGR
jgi:O-antigen/teichoic acid export membrane protein